jgi:hypothetical protein
VRGEMTVLELFKNAAKIKQLYDEGSYLKAAVLFLKTMTAMASEFVEGEGGEPKLKGAKKVKAADVKNLEKAEAVLTELQAAPRPVGAGPAGNPWVALIVTLLPYALDLIRRLRERNG